jgi:magnesium transporter
MAANDDAAWEQLRTLVRSDDARAVEELLTELSAPDSLRAMFRLSPDDQEALVRLISPDHAADLLDDLPEEHAADLLERLDAEDAADIVSQLNSDAGADLLGELEDEDATAILNQMEPERADEVRQLIVYDSDIAGGLMTTERFAFPATMRAGELRRRLDDLRRADEATHAGNRPPQNIFVVDADDQFVGMLDVTDLLFAEDDMPLGALARGVHPVDVMANLTALENYFGEYEAFSAPVVDASGKLVGRLRRRAVFEALSDRAHGEGLRVQGIVGGEELRSMPVSVRWKRRLSWLSVNIVLNMAAASIIAMYEETLSALIALAVFLPIVSDMSGCQGNQAVAVSMRELTLGIVQPRDALRVWWQEVRVGVLNGITLGAVLAIVAWLWKGNAWLGAVIGGALAVNTVIAVSLGGTIPLLLKRLRADPAVASGPLLTTLTDMCGFFLVLGLATLALPILTA